MHHSAIAKQPDYVEPRQFQRVSVDLLGRFMLEDRSEHGCRIEAMSPGDATVRAPVTPRQDESVIFYVDHVGRLEGSVLRVFAGGFAVSLKATERKREKLAAQLTWLANRHELDLPEDRRHERVQPAQSFVDATFEDGRSCRVRIIDLSLSGAAVQSPIRPTMGSRVFLGSTQGRVVRLVEGGFAMEFSVVQTRETLERGFD
ncbi:PilZ domain-containing protein [Consotaella salsifontis]|uniref:PilZ domain-containing protein n=1 Tax=Consotaella salsifontis TaxID=1365950 RepID=A0A1T4L781_9HYPH|nr:PilZ domain-containing protein [Consotaella salsifontis]SJZ50575.1 PilZ domain-containing protein [Consotaella salsifontis]